MPFLALELAWLLADELQPNMHVLGVKGDARRVLRLDPAFNPRFRPIVFHDEPHTAYDFDRDDAFAVVVPAGWFCAPERNVA